MYKTVCGIILVAEKVEVLAKFYTKVLKIPLEKEDHAGLDAHYGCDIGKTHFGIHPKSNFPNSKASVGSVVAFNVDSLKDIISNLEKNNIKYDGPKNEGFGTMISLKDPNNNIVEIVDLDYNFD